MNGKTTYLLTYNALLAIGWLVFLIYQVLHGFQLDSTSLWLLNVVQVAAFLEVLHAMLKWVKTPVFTSLIQISSRVFVLVWINLIPQSEMLSIAGIDGVAMVSVAWGITEVVRYSFYFLGLLNQEVYPIVWMRYSFFLVLYPLGVTGEWFILLSQMAHTDWSINLINVILAGVLLSYFYYFPQLFGYMLKQRKKKLA